MSPHQSKTGVYVFCIHKVNSCFCCCASFCLSSIHSCFLSFSHGISSGRDGRLVRCPAIPNPLWLLSLFSFAKWTFLIVARCVVCTALSRCCLNRLAMTTGTTAAPGTTVWGKWGHARCINDDVRIRLAEFLFYKFDSIRKFSRWWPVFVCFGPISPLRICNAAPGSSHISSMIARTSPSWPPQSHTTNFLAAVS